MSVGHGIFLLIRAGSTADPHIDGLPSVNDKDCNGKSESHCGVMQVCEVQEYNHSTERGA